MSKREVVVCAKYQYPSFQTDGPVCPHHQRDDRGVAVCLKGHPVVYWTTKGNRHPPEVPLRFVGFSGPNATLPMCPEYPQAGARIVEEIDDGKLEFHDLRGVSYAVDATGNRIR